ncbi:MAG: hypothetical protein CME06_14155 [Gemmatimonadetes bacterium]|nr:hypothetical protein [Gemmatimonadota bacterium]
MIIAAFVAALTGCGGNGRGSAAEGEPSTAVEAVRPKPPSNPTPDGETELLLVGLDGATWHVIDSLLAQGNLPNLSRLIETGVRGRLESERPIQSPPVWTTIATGKTREQHGIETFFVVRDDDKKIPVTTRMRTARPFWDIFSEMGISVGVMGWWPSWPAEEVRNGFIISDRAWPVRFSPNAVPYGTRRDETGSVVEWDFERRTWPEELFEEFRPFIVTEEAVVRPEITEQIFGSRAKPRQEMWNAYWVYAKDITFVRSGLHFLSKRRPRVFAIYLEGADVMSHYYWHYRPAEKFEISPEDRALFGDAVDRYYRYADEVIGRLLRTAGEETAILIVSDHGFETLWDLKVKWERGEEIEHEGGKGGYPYTHALHGIFIASGPGFANGVRVEGASIYDVMPTLMHRMGLPAGEDMPGRVLKEAFESNFIERHPLERIPTWERAEQQKSTDTIVEGPMDDAILEKLKTLGYVD